MGQISCKPSCFGIDCSGGEEMSRPTGVTWADDNNDNNLNGSDASSNNRSNGGSSIKKIGSAGSLADPRRDSRVKRKKRTIALHAELRDRQAILAPPVVSESMIVSTDNVFEGENLGVDTYKRGELSSVAAAGGSGGMGSVPEFDVVLVSAETTESDKIVGCFERSPEEDEFIEKAIFLDDNNYLFADSFPDHLKQELKYNMERILVPKNTLLIKKGCEPDYLYLILEGEVAVYIDPSELLDQTAVDLGKNKVVNYSVSSSSNPAKVTPDQREATSFKQSYFLELRKSMFPSVDKGSLVSQVLSMIRRDSGTAETTTLAELFEATSTVNDDDDAVDDAVPLDELSGLKRARLLTTGDVFGELSIIYDQRRTASCITETDCIMYRLESLTVKRCLSSSNAYRERKRYTDGKAAIESLYYYGIIENLDDETVRDLESALHPIVFEMDDAVFTKGTIDEMFFFVMSGELLVHDIGFGDSQKAELVLKEGDHFGELNLLYPFTSIGHVTVTSSKARLMAILKKDYKKRKRNLQPLMETLWRRNALLTIPLFQKSQLSTHEISSLVHKFETITFKKGKIRPASGLRSGLLIILTGKIQTVINMMSDGDGIVNTFVRCDHVGQRSIFDTEFYDRKGVEVRALVDTNCLFLSRESITSVIGKLSRLGQPAFPFSRKLVKGLSLKDLQLHKIIGRGMFGRVWLVSHKDTKSVYAMKVMDKKTIVDRKMVKGVKREKNVLSSIDHPFIVNLLATFQGPHSIHMLLDYVQGGELFGLIYHVSKKGYLSNDAAAFYGAGLVEALCHLHSRSIAHRDIKPENCLINSHGYLVIADFGFSKVVLDWTYTMCGSPEYMAPELLLGKGHHLSVDHWSLGVIIYEMLIGQTPFIHVNATRMTLFRRICNGSFAFPNASKHGISVSTSAKTLIKKLLTKDSSQRLGSSLLLGDEEIRTDEFFEGLLTTFKRPFLKMQITPPWLPSIDNDLDTSYFQSHEEYESEIRSKKKRSLDRSTQKLFEDF